MIKETIKELLDSLGEGMKAHDVRLVTGPTHTNIVFDIAVPADSKLDPESLKLAVSTALVSIDPNYRCVIKIDRDYA